MSDSDFITSIDQLLSEIKPTILGWIGNVPEAAGIPHGGSVPNPHAIVGTSHYDNGLTAGYVLRAAGTDTTAWARLAHGDLGTVGADDHHAKSHTHLADGSGTVAHSSLGSVGANDHHAQAHVLSGADHTASGLTTGQVLRASGASTFGWSAIQDGDLPTTLAGKTLTTPTIADFTNAQHGHTGATSGGTLSPAWTDLPVGINRSLVPVAADTYDLGSASKPWNAGYISSQYSTLFVQNVAQLFGGYLIVPKDSGTFAAAVGSADTTIDFGKAMTASDIVCVRALDTGGAAKTEYISVGTLVSGTTYNVTRDLAAAHGTDPAWASGTAFAVFGTTGNGRIEINATSTPRLSIIRKTGTAYNAESEVVRIGDLNGIGGIGAESYGFFAGDASAGNYMRYEPGSGLVFKAGGGDVTIDSTGLNIGVGSGRTQGTSVNWMNAGNTIGFVTTTRNTGLTSFQAGGNSTTSTDTVEAELAAIVDNGMTGVTLPILVVTAEGLTRSYANLWDGKLAAGGALVGLCIGATSGPVVPNAMLDIRGSGIFTGGLNVGSATGAATGAVKTSGDGIFAGGVNVGSATGAATGAVKASGQLISTLATGTAPLSVTSTTAVANLNADTVDGKHASDLSPTIFSQTASVTVRNVDTNEHTLTGSGTGSLTLAAAALTAGKTIRITAQGYKTNGGNGDTATFKAKLGSVIVCSLAVNITQPADGGWRIESLIACRTTGATGTVFGQLMFLFGYNNQHSSTKNTATSTVDTTGTLALDLTITHSSSTNSEDVTLTNLTVELI